MAVDRPVSKPRGVERKAKILRRAASLFDQNGYHNTSMEDIAAAVGVRKPTLYHYYKGKEEILFCIHEEFVDLLTSRLEARLQTPMASSSYLLELMADVLGLMETHRGHVRVFFEHHRELPDEYVHTIKDKRHHIQALVEDMFQKGIQAGEFRPVDVRLTAMAFFGMSNWAYQWYRSDGRLRPREIAQIFWDLLSQGIAAVQEPDSQHRRRVGATSQVSA
jgi:AcrR family transcriptional regulator